VILSEWHTLMNTLSPVSFFLVFTTKPAVGVMSSTSCKGQQPPQTLDTPPSVAVAEQRPEGAARVHTARDDAIRAPCWHRGRPRHPPQWV
jgi:uncharacterized iron-regulated membrane protein